MPMLLYFDAGVGEKQDNMDVESSGLLDNLEGTARQERAELIAWLLERGFDVDQIRGAFIPMLLPANRAIGDDGTPVSAREVSRSPAVSASNCFNGSTARRGWFASAEPLIRRYGHAPTLKLCLAPRDWSISARTARVVLVVDVW